MIDFIKKPKKFSQSLLFLVAAGLAFFLVATFIFYQVLLKVINLTATNRELRQKKAILAEKLSYLQNLDKAKLAQQVKELEFVFPSKKAAIELLNSLQLLASQNNLILEDFKVEDQSLSSLEGGKKKYESFPVSFTLVGQAANIAKFVKDLPKTPPVARIVGWQLKLEDKPSPDNLVFLTLECQVFWQAIPETIPSIDSPIEKITDAEEKILDSLNLFNFKTAGAVPTGNVGKEDPFTPPL